MDIVHCYFIKRVSQAEVAKRFKVTTALVSRLVVEAKLKPEKLRELKLKEKTQALAQLRTKQVTTDMLENGKSITNCLMV